MQFYLERMRTRYSLEQYSLDLLLRNLERTLKEMEKLSVTDVGRLLRENYFSETVVSAFKGTTRRLIIIIVSS